VKFYDMLNNFSDLPYLTDTAYGYVDDDVMRLVSIYIDKIKILWFRKYILKIHHLSFINQPANYTVAIVNSIKDLQFIIY